MKKLINKFFKENRINIVVHLVFIMINMYLLTYPALIVGDIIDLLYNIEENRVAIINNVFLLMGLSILLLIVRLTWKYFDTLIPRSLERILKDSLFEHLVKMKITDIQKIKEKIDNVSISTDIIVGFPNETEEDFKETLDICEYCKFDNAFTFIYSKRENTPAAKLIDEVSLEEKEERLQRLNNVVNKYFLENNKKLIGSEVLVLTEGISEKKDMYYGYTETNKLVNFTGENINFGDIVKVEILEAKTWSLDGHVK